MVSILIIALLFLSLFIAWRMFFLRDPERIISNEKNIVSPADGYIVYIRRIKSNDALVSYKNNSIVSWKKLYRDRNAHTSGYLIGIAMTPLSVHRNRIPVAGKIRSIKHCNSENKISLVTNMVNIALKRTLTNEQIEPTLDNEKACIEVETGQGSVYVTQIAGKTIDRIVLWKEEGDIVSKGEQYGMIRFGSQCDVFIPDTLLDTLCCNVGEHVYAGTSTLGTRRKAPNTESTQIGSNPRSNS